MNNQHVIDYQYHLLCKYEEAGNMHAAFYRLRMLAKEIQNK